MIFTTAHTHYFPCFREQQHTITPTIITYDSVCIFNPLMLHSNRWFLTFFFLEEMTGCWTIISRWMLFLLFCWVFFSNITIIICMFFLWFSVVVLVENVSVFESERLRNSLILQRTVNCCWCILCHCFIVASWHRLITLAMTERKKHTAYSTKLLMHR